MDWTCCYRIPLYHFFIFSTGLLYREFQALQRIVLVILNACLILIYRNIPIPCFLFALFSRLKQCFIFTEYPCTLFFHKRSFDSIILVGFYSTSYQASFCHKTQKYRRFGVHYDDVTCVGMVSQTTGLWSVCSTDGNIKTAHSTTDSFLRRIHRWPVDSPHKGPWYAESVPNDVINNFNWVRPSVAYIRQ